MSAAVNRETLCAGECPHLDCISAKQIAATRCRICQERIGLDRPFYGEAQGYVHKACLEEEILKKTTAPVEKQVTFLTLEETAEILRVTPGTLRGWVFQKRIPFRKVGTKVAFLLEEVVAWTEPKSRDKKSPRLKEAV